MIELLKILLSLSLSGTLLILVLFLCRPLYKNRLSRQWQYYIWLIVVARLLLPFTPEISLAGTVFHHIDNAVIQTNNTSQQEQGTPVLPETDIVNQDNTSAQQAGIGNGGHSEPVKPIQQNVLDIAAQNMVAICLLVWLFVAVVLFIRKVTLYQSFVKYIEAGRAEISDFALWEQVGKLVEQTGIKKSVELYTNSLISSPLLIGFFRPCIMLPMAELSESDMQNTILHELTHYKRRDMFYKWLVQVTVCLHWFNPLVYLMVREINQACELSCDEAVIKSLDAGERRAYGDTLLNSLGMGGSYKSSVAPVTLNENAELLKERLDAIMSFKKTTRLTAAISIALVLVLCFGATAAGAYTSGSVSSKTMPLMQGESESSQYSIYSEYGIHYDESTDSLYYNDELIRYFEDNSIFYNGDGTINGSLIFHTDKNGNGKIDVYIRHNSNNEIAGVEIADEDTFAQKTYPFQSMSEATSIYQQFGISVDMFGDLYYDGFLVRELYDPVAGNLITKGRGADFPKDSVDIIAVYEEGQLSGLRVASQKEYDVRTQERIEAVQEFWVEQQKQRN